MLEEASLRCCLCGRVASNVAMAVKTGDFVGEYHLIPRCVDTEACWRRVNEQIQAPAQDMTLAVLREAIEDIKPKP